MQQNNQPPVFNVPPPISQANMNYQSHNIQGMHQAPPSPTGFNSGIHSNRPPVDLSIPPPLTPQSDPSISQINMMQSKINEIKDHIYQSEKNLKAQSDVFDIKKKIQIEELLKSKKNEKLNNLLRESQLDIASFEQISNKIIELCTKEAIGNGRNFVFNKNLDDKKIETICYYLLQKIINKDSTDDARLHLIYFINDIIHNANRKEIEMIKRNLENIIVPCFCYAVEKTDDDKRSKMNKLLELWEKNKYFSLPIIEKLKNPISSVKFHEDIINEESNQTIKLVEDEVEKTLKQYEKQHKEFVEHSNNQINSLEIQINQIVQQQIKKQHQMNMMIPPPLLMQNQHGHQQMIQSTSPHPPLISNPPQISYSNSILPSPSLMSNQLQQMNGNNNFNFNNNNTNNNCTNKFSSNSLSIKNPPALMSLMSINPFASNSNNQNQIIPIAPPLMSIPPPSLINPEVSPCLDLSRPPPGFGSLQSIKPGDQASELELPYYKLPAGLMLKIIKPEAVDYEPLDQKKIKLTAVEPPNEKLIKALEEFFLPSSPTKPRNSYGWEKNGLYEFYKSKIKALLLKKAEKENKKKRKKNKTRQRSRERTDSKYKHSRRSRRSYSISSRSSCSSRSKSRSKSPSCSPQKQPSRHSPVNKPKRRSITPPYMSSASAISIDQHIDSSNKGHQLLQKMGYSGGGLGKREQGIVNPIEGGEAREKVDQYKGIGMRSDPFEAFRKNKAQGYIQRLRDRDETRREESLKKTQFSEEKN